MRTTKHQLKMQIYSLQQQLLDSKGTEERLRHQLAQAVYEQSATGLRLKLVQYMGHLGPELIQQYFDWVVKGELPQNEDKEREKV